MGTNPLYINFLWHMHQPYYKDPLTNESSMPWVRLHGIKDYLDMVLILKDYPDIKQTFNLVPSLIVQIQDYLSNNVKDKFLEISKKPSKSLSEDDKIFILSNFFMANWKTMVEPYPRYFDLLMKRGRYAQPAQMKTVLCNFSEQDFLDLQIWFNLSWFDPFFKESITELKGLIEKGRNFTEGAKVVIFEKQNKILSEIISTYKNFQDNNQIEITTSPYYHPILPLLFDVNCAKEGIPSIKLPDAQTNFTDDIKWQIHNAVLEYKKHFGKPPSGMWPSEGSLSNDIIPFFVEDGIKWIATDQEILYRSTTNSKTFPTIYEPYLIKNNQKELNIFFRDHVLSDLIGFVYYSWDPATASDDFIKRLHILGDSLKDSNRPKIVNIILDGENAWEYYANDGRPFLKKLYEKISNDTSLKTITPSEFLQKFPATELITRLFAGSWINGNFAIWIGHPEKNTAWEYLSKTRKTLLGYQKENPNLDKSLAESAWQEIYIAEGSDWNWWYGEDHSTSFDEEFDRLYRTHLSNVYRILGLAIPDWLDIPIKVKKPVFITEPTALIGPSIDGKVTSYFEWLYAGKISVAQLGGTMHQSESFLRYIYYGFSLDKLFMRFDLDIPPEYERENLSIVFYCITSQSKIEVLFSKNRNIEAWLLYKDANDNWSRAKMIYDVAFSAAIELSISFDDLLIRQEEEIKAIFIIQKNGMALESIPHSGPIIIKLPSKDFDALHWSA